jgi:amino acid transporter
MSNDTKKSRLKLVRKELGIAGLVILWGIAILLKEELTGIFQMIVFIALVILTILGLYGLNKSFFGANETNNKKENKK